MAYGDYIAGSGKLIKSDGSIIDILGSWCSHEEAWQVELLAEKKMLQGKIFLLFQQLTVPTSGFVYAALEIGDVPVMANIQSVTLADGLITVELFEEADLTTGTPITANNMNRESSAISSAIFSLAPTVISEGTKLDHLSIGATTIGNAISISTLGAKLAWRLKPNTKYLLKLSNAEATDVDATFRVTIVED